MNQQQNSEKTAVKRNQSSDENENPNQHNKQSFFFKNLDIKKQKLNKSYKQYCNQFMFDDYKRLTDVV